FPDWCSTCITALLQYSLTSSGEAYMVDGLKEKAISNYDRSTLMKPDSENRKKMLEKIRMQ
ncbi:MAG: hypothetical protein R3209_11030, partial [Salinimicrobium sediminis]|nr:hypothetical protein [Salinimicrobium sediminis]